MNKIMTICNIIVIFIMPILHLYITFMIFNSYYLLFIQTVIISIFTSYYINKLKG